ncbi:thiamine pyrophosphate-binding protein [Streptomyces sp. NPDC088360]|uniref:thiamine pyrophosphate-binding protein n=1 Tax=Streptomyces sp. NPDC088360 TaxID=3154515 RepID=UPI00344CCA6D
MPPLHYATGGDLLVAVLRELGVDTVFGIVSVHNLPLVEAVDRELRFVPVRHEATAVNAADAYGRARGSLGCALTSTGTGAGNAAGSLVEALSAGTSVLHVTGQVEAEFLGSGRGFIHETKDQLGMLGAVSKYAATIPSADTAGRILREAARAALTDPGGPASVEWPVDLQYAAQTDPESSGPTPSTASTSAGPAGSTDPTSAGPAGSTASTDAGPAGSTAPTDAGPAGSTAPASAGPTGSTASTSAGPAGSTAPASAGPTGSTASTSAGPAGSTDPTDAGPAGSTAPASAGPTGSTDPTSAGPAGSTDPASAGPTGSTASTSAGPAGSTDPTDAYPASSTHLTATDPTASTDSTDAYPASSTHLTATDPTASTNSTDADPTASTNSTDADPAGSTGLAGAGLVEAAGEPTVAAPAVADAAEGPGGRPTTAPAPSGARRPGLPRPTEGELAAAQALLGTARRPLVWAGGGATRAGAELAELLHATGAGLLSSNSGRGSVPEDHPQVIGNFATTPAVRSLLADADLLLTIGTHFRSNETADYGLALPEAHVQVDIDAEALGRVYPARHALHGHAPDVLAALLPHARRADESWTRRVAAVREDVRATLHDSIGPQAAICDAIRAALPREAVVARDVTIPSSSWGNRLLEMYDPRDNVFPRGGGIGQGLGMGIGAALARPDAPTVVLAGDGGLAVHLGELLTLAQERPRLTLIVFNDGGYGVLRNMQDRYSERRSGVDLATPDFELLARACGLAYARIAAEEHAQPVISHAVASAGPTLVEVDLARLGPMKNPFTPPVKIPGQ